MSTNLNDSFVSNSDDFDKENDCCEHKKTAEIVDSLSKWVSTVDSKATHCVSSLEQITETLDRHESFLLSIKQLLTASKKQEQLARRVQMLEDANLELGIALSAKLFKSDAKRNKGSLPQTSVVGAIHPSVLPFLIEKQD
jgi:hypothetical protein